MAKKRFELENEQLIVSSILKSEDFRKIAFRQIEEKDFQSDRHQTIFSALLACVKSKVEITHTNIISKCEDRKFGGLDYLKKLDLLDPLPEEEFLARVDLLRMDSARFQVADELDEVGKRLLDKSVDFFDCSKDIASLGKVLAFAPMANRKFVLNKGDFWDEFQKRLNGESHFVSVGYTSLDSVLNEGFAPKNLTFVAGRPRMGKSICLVDMVRRYLTRIKKRVLVIPFEKGPQYFANMLVSSISGVDIGLILKNVKELSEDHLSAVSLAAKKVDDWIESGLLTIMQNPVNRLMEKSTWTNESALDELERVIAEGGYDIGFYDLLERCLVRVDPQSLQGSLTRVQSFGPRYGLHQVITHQISRKAEDREEHRPLLTDLKNSGIYEEIPDQTFLIHREKIYKPNLPIDVFELHLAKQKLGEGDCVMLANFEPSICRLSKDRLIDFSEIKKGNLILRKI